MKSLVELRERGYGGRNPELTIATPDHGVSSLPGRNIETNANAVEYAGSAVRAIPVKGRLTIGNLSIEFGAKVGMIGPDEMAYDYLAGRQYAPKGHDLDKAVSYCKSLATDANATFDADEAAHVEGAANFTVDLDYQIIISPSGAQTPFKIDELKRHAMLEGLNDIGVTLAGEQRIADFQAADRLVRPWIYAA